MSGQTNQRVYFPLLDVLRGVAVSFVVLYHLFDFVPFFRFGWMGVDLFFVLSGFLITDTLMRSRGQKAYFRSFYVRRTLRILPLYYGVLAAFFFLAPWVFTEKGPQTVYGYYTENQPWFWIHLQNWLIVEKGHAPVPFLSHFWSLAVEEQFYLLWPVVVFAVHNTTTLKKVILGLMIFAICLRVGLWWQQPQAIEKYYCNTFARMDSLLAGALLAVHLYSGQTVQNRLAKVPVLAFSALIVCSLAVCGNVNQGNFLFTTVGYTVSALFFCVVIHKILMLGPESRWDWLKPLHFLGRISYGVYVFHLPVYLVVCKQFSEVAAKVFVSDDLTRYALACLSLTVTFILSTLSFRYVERPFLQLKNRLVPNPAPAR